MPPAPRMTQDRSEKSLPCTQKPTTTRLASPHIYRTVNHKVQFFTTRLAQSKAGLLLSHLHGSEHLTIHNFIRRQKLIVPQTSVRLQEKDPRFQGKIPDSRGRSHIAGVWKGSCNNLVGLVQRLKPQKLRKLHLAFHRRYTLTLSSGSNKKVLELGTPLSCTVS